MPLTGFGIDLIKKNKKKCDHHIWENFIKVFHIRLNQTIFAEHVYNATLSLVSAQNMETHNSPPCYFFIKGLFFLFAIVFFFFTKMQRLGRLVFLGMYFDWEHAYFSAEAFSGMSQYGSIHCSKVS